jgi:DUF177 domain-containing protein
MEIIDPYAYATQGRHLEGSVQVSALTRLISLLTVEEGEDVAQYSVAYQLVFGVDKGGVRGLLGTLKTTLPLMCQRCMGGMLLDITVDLQLAMVRSREAAQQLPESYDPLLVSDEEITIESLVEDELILALPLVAMHEIKDCPKGDAFLASSLSGDEQAPKRKNPFAVLAELKTSQSKKDA